MKEIHIVFDGPPGPEAGRFVEVEDENGKSFNAGDWRQRADGLWELVIKSTTPDRKELPCDCMMAPDFQGCDCGNSGDTSKQSYALGWNACVVASSHTEVASGE